MLMVTLADQLASPRNRPITPQPRIELPAYSLLGREPLTARLGRVFQSIERDRAGLSLPVRR